MDPSSSSSPNKTKRDLDYYDEPRYKSPKFHVFVNYAPKDLGKSFASHLKSTLRLEGFRICDHTEPPKGQDKSSELLKAIEDSEIYVVVFSPGYASSESSLDELVRIKAWLGNKFDQGRVLPVFFNVEATDVKKQQGPFLDAFKNHETKFDPNKVQNWRQSLREAGHLSGLNLKDCQDENQLKRKIIEDVRKMQKPQQLCYVEHPVGIDSRAQDIISALRLTDPAPSIVAVLGMSGSGKTTIAKAVYDRIAADFEVSCFIQDINNIYRGPNWKVELQRDVISYLTRNDNFVANHNDGAAKIRNLISGQKLLLVLDDVYTFEQLQALSIPSDSLHPASRIIVTTRNTKSLVWPHTRYDIRLLDKKESIELFTRLIGKGGPIDNEFVDAIVHCAGGIPLVLEVWSRYFIAHKRKLWPSVLDLLKRIPHEDTQKKLQISYDSLSERDKDLFLDIACFFHGMSEDLIVKVLKDEDFFPYVEIQIQNLVDKFLVKYIGYEQKVLLHDVIREMGKEVVHQEDKDVPGKRTRLMGYRDVVGVLGDCSGTDSVRSIKLDESDQMEEEATVQLEAFKKMSNLRFIKLDHPNLQWSSSSNDGMSACFPYLKYLVQKRNKVPCFSFKQLKYLEWKWFPCKSLDNIDMDNVVVVILQKSKLKKLWDGVKSSKKPETRFKKLKILEVGFSYSLTKTGDFTGLENLEELKLFGCKDLKELDSSIGCLQELHVLDVSCNRRLKRLPQLTSLQKLKHLNLNRNTFSSLPDLPRSIEYVEANGCINLVNLPSNCSELQSLTKLELDNCSKLGYEGFKQVTELKKLLELSMINCNVLQVPSEIGNLVSLRLLNLSGNKFKSLPDSFSNLSELVSFYIYNCSELQLLPPLPSQLTYIGATNCGSLDVMSFDSMKKALFKVFKESLMNTTRLYISLSGKKLPEWCTYQKSGRVLSFKAPVQLDSKICGLILCTTTNLRFSRIHNETKNKSHFIGMSPDSSTLKVVFYPLNDKTVEVEAGDTVKLWFNGFTSCGLRLVYEGDVADSGLVLPS